MVAVLLDDHRIFCGCPMDLTSMMSYLWLFTVWLYVITMLSLASDSVNNLN